MWTRDAGLIASFVAVAVLVVLPIQLLLCFRAKKRYIKLLPVIVLTLAVTVLYVMAITARDWSGFAYIILAAFAGVLLIFSGLAWGIWAIVKLVKKNSVARNG